MQLSKINLSSGYNQDSTLSQLRIDCDSTAFCLPNLGLLQFERATTIRQSTLRGCRAGFKGGAQGTRAPGLPPINRGPPTKPVICYLSFMLVVYKTDSLTPENWRCFDSKSIKVLPPGPFFFGSNMHQIVQRLGLRPRPYWGSSQRSLKLPSW